MKRKLLFAMLCIVSVLGLRAQSWTAPTIQGEDPVSGNDYVIFNVGAGVFVYEGNGGLGWNTTTIADPTNAVSHTFVGDAASFTLYNTNGPGKKGYVFTSGNGITGDAMHSDGGSATNYALTKLANGNYHIHDVGGDASSLCWGYNSSVYAKYIVAHADADAEGWNCEWVFLSDMSAANLYAAKLKLYNLLLAAQSEGANTDEAGAVYNKSGVTTDELNAACTALNVARASNLIAKATDVSEENPVEITNLVLVNPDFEVATANGVLPPGWTITIKGANCGQQNRTDKNPDTNLTITNFIEAWHWEAISSGVIAQTVSSLPEGTYKLECDASVCHDPAAGDGSDIKGAYLFIKSSLKTETEPVGNVRLGIKHYDVKFSHGGTGEVQFGLMATEEINANWLSADNFKIFYVGGVDLSIYQEALADAVAEFEALQATSEEADYNTYYAVVDENNKEWSTTAEYQAAIDAVHDATSALTAINSAKTAYSKAIADAKVAKEAYPEVTGVELTALNEAVNDTPDQTVESMNAKAAAINEALATFTSAAVYYKAYIVYRAETVSLFGEELAAEAVSTAPTTAAAAAAAVQNLNIAQYNKVASDYTFSATGLIGDFGSWTGTATVAGEAATPNYLDWEHWSGQTHAYYEQASNGWGNANGWTIKYEKKCTLPPGDYVIKVAARSSAGTTSEVTCSATDVKISLPNLASPGRGINTSGVASWSDEDTFANGDINKPENAPTVGGKGTGWQWRFLPFTLAEQTEVTMTFYAEASTQYQWMSIADGELLSTTKLAQDVTYDESADNTIENTIIADVTMTRTIKEGFNTVVVPFTLTANQVTDAFGTGTEVYAFSENSADADNVTINFSKGDGSITANVPVLVKATEASDKQVFKGVQIVAPTADVKVAGTNTNFIGIYAPATVIAGDYFVGNGALYKSAGETSIKAFRAYIDAQESGSDVKLFIDGVATSINAINGVEAENGAIFNLAGQRVNKAQKGIYIINGKKVLVK